MTAPTSRAPAYVTVIGGFLGFVGVAAGAFGAHALRGDISPRDLEIWETAARYQLIHAILLVIVGLIGQTRWSRAMTVASVSLSVGIVVFAGTLQVMALGGPRWLGAITPVGGLCLMAGWLALAAHGALVWRSRNADGLPSTADDQPAD